MKIILSISFLILINMSCQPTDPNKTISARVMDIQGHRGCRGLMPENTLPAFQKALELGVTTLEMDLVISKDDKVVVSHEPYFRAGIALDPEGNPITKENEKEHNIYKMEYADVRNYKLGVLPDPNHPDREDVATYKPLFSQVIDQAQDFSQTTKSELPFFNIEIKRVPDYDGEFHPVAEKYVELVLEVVRSQGIEEKTIIQSFDPESLRITKMKMPSLKTALLIQNLKSPQENIQELGFKPDIYSSYFGLLNQEVVADLQSQEIQVIPWTVNKKEDIQRMLDMKVDGIISDYPNLVIEIAR